VAALVLLLSGCSGVTSKVDTLLSSTTAAPPTSASTASAVTAQQVVDEFAAKGLPVPNARNNSKNCTTQGCSQLVTTDAITVATFPDEAAATKYADAMTGAGGAFRHKLVVLSYAAANTPAADRPKYEAALTALVP
jgi:uncharacterized protein YceK